MNMKYELIDSYTNTPLNPREIGETKNTISVTYLDGPKVEVTGPVDEEYEVRFINATDGSVVYKTTIKNNMWTSSTIKYFVNWKIEVRKNGIVIKEDILSLKSKKVKIVLDTQSIGDLIAYIGAVEAFRKKYGCETHCVVFNPDMRRVFEGSYKNITFLSVDGNHNDYYAIYKIGWFNEWEGRAHKNPQVMSLANIASSILGFGYLEFKPTLAFKKNAPGTKKYVCIGIQSTAQFKYWNNPTGWDEVVQYLNSIGYEVWCIDKFGVFGHPNYPMNKMPKGVVDMTGNYSIEDRLHQLSGAEFFIGISSGLSWLAWSVGIPVIMVSGIGKRWTEFFTPHRIINESVCNSCTNDTAHKFDKGNWLHCPRNKNFECTKEISSKTVIAEIDKVVSDFYKTMHRDFDWGSYSTTPQTELLYREIYLERVYERILQIDEGDVVMDIGAHVGSFSYSAIRANPKRIIMVEPSSIRMNTIKHNFRNVKTPISYIRKGVTAKREVIKDGLEFDSVVEDFETIPFFDLIKEYHVPQIDFLKIDCEGGEYDVFTAENLNWISKNVKKVVGEWHLESHEKREAFRKFRDQYLSKIKNYHVYSVDGIDIKWDLFNEHFIQFYHEILIYIDNRETFERNDSVEIEVTRVGPEERQGNPLVTDPAFYNRLFNLSGKVAVVTGAGGHLGSAMCMGLVAHGAKVYALGRDVDKIKTKLHTSDNYLKENIIPIACDVTNSMQVEAILDQLGAIDLLVNNAFNEKRKPFEDLTETDWSDGMDAILTQQFICCKAVLPKMAARGVGNIINIASIYGSIGIDQRAYRVVPSSTVFYCAAKAGSIQLSKELAVQYADKGVRINCISPGHFPKPPADPTKANPQYVKGLADMVPMQRVGCADEIAGAVVFLASDASSYITGHNLIVDGGRTIW